MKNSVKLDPAIGVHRLAGNVLGRGQVHSELADVLGRFGAAKRDQRLDVALPGLFFRLPFLLQRVRQVFPHLGS